MKISLFLATTVLAQGNKGRGRGSKRVLDSEARCNLRPQDGMNTCCVNYDYDYDADYDYEPGCNHFKGCVPALLEQGIPCSQHPDNCMCDSHCVHFQGKTNCSIFQSKSLT